MINIDIEKRYLTFKGLQVDSCSPDEWLSLALHAEDNAKVCGPFDPAYSHMIECARLYERAAALAETLAYAG